MGIHPLLPGRGGSRRSRETGWLGGERRASPPRRPAGGTPPRRGGDEHLGFYNRASARWPETSAPASGARRAWNSEADPEITPITTNAGQKSAAPIVSWPCTRAEISRA